MFLSTFKACMVPLQSDDIFKSDTRSIFLLSRSFVCRTPGPLHACSSPVLSIAVCNCKNICNCSICCNSVISSSNNVASISKPVCPVFSSSDSIINISESLKFTPTYLHSIDSSTSVFRVVGHHNIHRKRKLVKV